jgi:formate-dependent nitrite reductase cytochrome c552 subunit
MPGERRTWGWWIAALIVTLALSGYFGARLLGDDRMPYIPGQTTHGHYQIEIACDACHTPFAGVTQAACTQCHGAELAAVNDSHPRKKFEDPRNADRLEAIDALRCVTCHVEHRPERTRAMGVTLPDDFCHHCHADVAKERPSHRDYAFTTCASGGCHNYHDNTVLYEDFLGKHLNEPAVARDPRLPARTPKLWLAVAFSGAYQHPLTRADADTPGARPELIEDWATTAHARANVNCRDCHAAPADTATASNWHDRPSHEACARCHDTENKGWLAGKHGMRLERGLSALRPENTRAPMKTDAHGRELGCTSCHGAHRFETRRAAIDACLGCHDDSHSRAYRDSPHFRLWQAEIEGRAAAGSGVSCASCHLPREPHKDGERSGVRVQHNQNHNLRPNEKMARNVCMACHGLRFTLDALADSALVARNFAGQPARHVESLDLAAARLKISTKPKP